MIFKEYLLLFMIRLLGLLVHRFAVALQPPQYEPEFQIAFQPISPDRLKVLDFFIAL
jgi:hypothetical protein